jgi:uncharacterized protein (DUF2062 family)
MFKRRKPPALLHQLKGYFWPHIGWQRAGHYFWMRLKRLSGTPHSIAAGFASGAAASATPFVGFHFLTGFAIAFFVRGNYLAAAIGTAVGNPWTFPFIWAWTYSLGSRMLGRQNEPAPDWTSLSWPELVDAIGGVFLPMVVGGLPTAAVFWLVFYFPMLRLVRVFQETRRRKWERKRQERQKMAEQAVLLTRE